MGDTIHGNRARITRECGEMCFPPYDGFTRGCGYFLTCTQTIEVDLPHRTMTSAFVCICNYNARNRRALAKHKQCCEVAREQIGSNFNVLLSTSMHCGGSTGGNDDCDNDGANNVVYELHDYNASNEYKDGVNDTRSESLGETSSCGKDDHSATISFCSMDVVDELNNN